MKREVQAETPTRKLSGISAFFPCYNDAGTIASIVTMAERTLRQCAETHEIIVIDDGSRDRSREVLAELERRYENLRVIHHEANRGYGGVLQTGFAAARLEWVFYTDGDYQFEVGEIPLLVNRAEADVDLINGWRTDRADGPVRKYVGQLYLLTVRRLFGVKLRDVDCDFRLIRRSLMERVALRRNDGLVCLELVAKLELAGARVREVGISHYGRAYGKSEFFALPRLLGMLGGVWGLYREVRNLRRTRALAPAADASRLAE